MEDVLDVYTQTYNAKYPLICMDETSKQQIEETRMPIPMKLGQNKCYDFEYKRNGVSNLFMFFAPIPGWRHVKVTDRRTKIDWAKAMREISDIHFPDAEKKQHEQNNRLAFYNNRCKDKIEKTLSII